MGDTDTPEPYEPLESQWASLLGFAERYRNLGYGPLADKLREGGSPPPRLQGTPIILDTRLGGDPGETVALTWAARNLPELALVVTTDEYRGGDRARLARHVLDLNERSEVPVVAGADLGNVGHWVSDGLTPRQIPSQSGDLLPAVRAVCSQVDTPVRWVGTGPLSNLSYVLAHAPELAPRLAITQTGGSAPDRVERNFGLDPGAARHVLSAAQRLLLLTEDVSARPETAVTSDSDLYQHLAGPDAPPWARLIHTHLDRWYAQGHSASTQNASLTLGAALQLPFLDFTRARLSVDTDARIRTDDDGYPTWIATQADYPMFWAWLAEQLHY